MGNEQFLVDWIVSIELNHIFSETHFTGEPFDDIPFTGDESRISREWDVSSPMHPSFKSGDHLKLTIQYTEISRNQLPWQKL